MATSLTLEPTQEVFSWLKSLPLAPEYHPTLQEFQDPISYIFKIEKEASKYGICKIVPPVSPSPKKTVIANLNKSLATRNGCSDSSNLKSQPTFTTRQQQIGFCPRKPRPVQRPVWQSGEYYTFQQFESKAKSFEKSLLRKCTKKGGLSPLEIETLYWKATVDKPFSVEYANDMPGSAFVPLSAKNSREAGEGVTLGETAWNMRAVSRSKGSLLRFMKEEIPGVTSPMVYVAMVFSWFAWHVEDHDLHSLNYMHLGAGKTWYGVPREAAVAFEEVVRVHGYGGEINPLVTFSTLGEKTTVISPEVFIKAGIPCCRLVQNAGEFVVTFPRAYHTGFSHGFNCGEAANIATPEWLRVAKDAAIRRASINYLPMVSHFQLLYDLALALCSRVPKSISIEPRSSRLKEKKKDEGETLVKELFVQNVMQNNDLLHVLGKGSSVILLPQSSSDISVCSKLRVGSQLRGNSRLPLGLSNSREEMNSSRSLVSDGLMIDRNQEGRQVKGFYPMKGKFASLSKGNQVTTLCGNSNVLNSRTLSLNIERQSAGEYDVLPEQRLFSCVTCGILNFACFAIVQPSESAARYLMSADCSFFNDWVVGSGLASNAVRLDNGEPISSEKDNFTGWKQKDVLVQTAEYQIDMADKSNEVASNAETSAATSALGLLALNYGNSSDSDNDQDALDSPVCDESCSPMQNIHQDASGYQKHSLSRHHSGDEFAFQDVDCYTEKGCRRDDFKDGSDQKFDCSVKSNGLVGKYRDPENISHTCSSDTYDAEITKFGKATSPIMNANVQLRSLGDEESSRMHVFCLEHAVEVEQQLRQIGGVNILLLCHPDYPEVEAKAKVMAEELGINNNWNYVLFRDATKEDEERIQLALDSEEAIPKNGDWSVKLGINLFYSANLSRYPLYSKQMPYNSVIYNVFGRSSPGTSPTRTDGCGTRSRRQKKIVAGKWCGKVWMSNQVHPFLKRHPEDDEEEPRSIHAQAVTDEKLVRKSDFIPKDESTMTAKKYVRKRKMTAESEVKEKAAKCVQKEEAISDNSLDDYSHQQNKRFVRSKQAIGFDGGSSKNVKHIETEATFSAFSAFSDDSMDDDSCQQQERIPRNRQSKFIGSHDIVSDDSLDVDSDQQHNSNPRSKKTKNAGKEEMVSDDSLDSNSHKLYKRISSRKQAIRLERDDSVSDGAYQDNNSFKQLRKIHKNKRAVRIEREEEDSDELVGENHPLQQHRRILRSKQKKVMTRQKMKHETGSLAKQATPQPEKQVSRRLAKQGIPRKVKQAPRRQNNLREQASESDDEEELDGPHTRLRKRSCQAIKVPVAKLKEQQQTGRKNVKSATGVKSRSGQNDAKLNEADYACEIEGCTMSFGSKPELSMHKRNICPVKGCGKKFFSHKYLVQHRRVHLDDRPLRCPWKGCKMTFKWAWARTEHIRVHTGARPYVCAEPGCGQTFRFVSDFSRHKRKTGHSVKKSRR